MVGPPPVETPAAAGERSTLVEEVAAGLRMGGSKPVLPPARRLGEGIDRSGVPAARASSSCCWDDESGPIPSPRRRLADWLWLPPPGLRWAGSDSEPEPDPTPPPITVTTCTGEDWRDAEAEAEVEEWPAIMKVRISSRLALLPPPA
jgi:hypothetical protein